MSKIQYLGANWKNDKMICSFPTQTIHYDSNSSLCPNQQCWRSWSWILLWRPTRPSRLTPKKDVLFYYRGLECKSRKSINTWSNRQIWPWNTEWSRAKTNRVLPREHTGHSKHPLTTTQDSTHGHHQSDWLYSLQLWRISIKSAKTRPGTDCSSDCGLLIAKFRLKMKKLGKTTRPFRYDLNQIPYDYTVEVRNRFKGLDLIECLMIYGMRFVTLYRRQGSRPSPWKRNAKKQNGCLRRPYKQLWKEEKWKAKEKRKDKSIWMQSSKE